MSPRIPQPEDEADLLSGAHPQAQPMTRGVELLDKAKRAEQELIELRRHTEQVELRRRQIEELVTKQYEVEAGRKEMVEKLRRSLVMLEREEDAAKREVEQISQTKEAFQHTLEAVERIDPESWDPDNLEVDLVRDLSEVDNARGVYTKHMAKVNALRGDALQDSAGSYAEPAARTPEDAGGQEGEFAQWLKRGFAFNFFLLLLGVAWLAIWIFKQQ